jgi:hypothetical protein
MVLSVATTPYGPVDSPPGPSGAVDDQRRQSQPQAPGGRRGLTPAGVEPTRADPRLLSSALWVVCDRHRLGDGEGPAKKIATLTHSGGATTLSWSPDGKTLLVCNVVNLMRGRTSSEVDTYPATGGHPPGGLSPGLKRQQRLDRACSNPVLRGPLARSRRYGQFPQQQHGRRPHSQPQTGHGLTCSSSSRFLIGARSPLCPHQLSLACPHVGNPTSTRRKEELVQVLAQGMKPTQVLIDLCDPAGDDPFGVATRTGTVIPDLRKGADSLRRIPLSWAPLIRRNRSTILVSVHPITAVRPS